MSLSRKSYQFALKSEECELFRLLRAEEDLFWRLASADDPKLKQTLAVSVNAGRRHLGSYDIDGTQIILKFAGVGAAVGRQLLAEQEPCEELDSAKDDSHLDRHNPFSGVQTQHSVKDVAEHDTDHRYLAWDLVRSHVKDTIFTIGNDDMSPECENRLRSLFPGVVIVRSLSELHNKPEQWPNNGKKPKGIKTMNIELEENEITENPGLEGEIRQLFPWALIKIVPEPESSKNHIIPALENGASGTQNLDPVKHLGDLFRYTTEPPKEGDFGFECLATEDWDTLSHERKSNVAHARLIHGRYGTLVNGGRCSHCEEHDYECKAYPNQLSKISQMILGHACHRCRLMSTVCDLPVAATDCKEQTYATPTASTSLDARNTMAVPTKEMTNPLSTATTQKPRSYSWTSMTNSDTITQATIANAPIAGDAIERASLNDQTVSMEQHGSTGFSSGVSIRSLAANIGLQLPSQVLSDLDSMCIQWQKDREVRPYAPRRLRLQQYYSNLINLYVLANSEKEMSLAYAILLRFQTTNYNFTGNLPEIGIVVHAFQHLPPDSPLCRWLAILYAFLWGTEHYGNYQDLMEQHPNLDHAALAKLLYAVAYIRDPLTMGHDIAVLNRWCEVHDHHGGSDNDKLLCNTLRSTVKFDLKEAQEKENTRILKEARRNIKQLAATSETRILSSSKKGKGRAEDSPARTIKKSKKTGD
ncbi:hypothetical protein BKA66DRAFT_570089 [Pyrenochaeta sp. MPI-SDFR-AT-0127]|nr:hypothetical protein BKA66DRAFT_570089 [Pyrenochaeta sp. MPI-SDFR-AT-0127]